MKLIVMLILLLTGFGCRSTLTKENVILTPKNDALAFRMKAMGCDCLYQDVKNHFFYNKETGLYFAGKLGTILINKENKTCLEKLTLAEIYLLLGPPHKKNQEGLHYYVNVIACGQIFLGFSLIVSSENQVIDVKGLSTKTIYPDDPDWQMDIRCREVEYTKDSKIKQGLFEYFKSGFIKKHFEPAAFIEVQPKFKHANFSQRALEAIQFQQTNFLYHKKLGYYLRNYEYSNNGYSLLGYQDFEYKNISSGFNKAELLIEAYGVPHYRSENKDTLVYVMGNKLYKGNVPQFTYQWSTEHSRYFVGLVKDLDHSLLPPVKDGCQISP